MNLIRSLSEKFGITVVIITHELEVIKSICGKCAVMDGGKLAEIGGVYDIFTNPQSGITKQLIKSTQRHELPDEVIKNTQGLLVKLTFLGSGANTPVISDVTSRFGIQFNIMVGRIEYIEDKPLGVLYVNPVGEESAVKKSLDYLKQVVKKVEVIDHGV